MFSHFTRIVFVGVVITGGLVWTYEPSYTLAATLDNGEDRIESVCFSQNGKLLASGSYDNAVKLWDVSTGKLIATLEGHSWPVCSVSFSQNGTLLASGSYDGTIKIWNVAKISWWGIILPWSAPLIATLEGHRDTLMEVSFSPDGTLLASGSIDGTIKLWDVATRELVATLEDHNKGAVHSISFNPDGTLLASGAYHNAIKIWDVATRKLVTTLKGHGDYLTSVRFSPDGQLLASGSYDRTVKLWHVATGKLAATLECHAHIFSVSFSPDGTLLALGTYAGTVMLWDVATRTLVATLEGPHYEPSCVTFSPDGRLLASGAKEEDNRMIKLWQKAVKLSECF